MRRVPSDGNTENHQLHYWIILALLFLLSLILGIAGFRSYFEQHQENPGWAHAIYCALQLFVLEGGDRALPLPCSLNIARFSAPMTSVLALILALFDLILSQWNRIRISLMKNHVVIIGLGTKGKNVMLESIQNKEKVLVIDHDLSNPNLALIKSPHTFLLYGDATQEITLQKAGISRAKSVFLLLDEDIKQVNACLNIYQILKKAGRDAGNPLICTMHLQKQEFLITLRNHKIVQDTQDGMVLSVFNVYENSARELFGENPPDRSGITAKSDNVVQVVIFGFGNAGEALAIQTALTGHYLNGKKPGVLIIDKLAREKTVDFLHRYPTFKEFVDLGYLALDANCPRLIPELVNKIEDPRFMTTMALCFDNKTQNLLLGLQLDRVQLNNSPHAPQIFIRSNDNEPFISFSQNIKPYGLFSKVCSPKALAEGVLDRKARAIHQAYLEQRNRSGNFGTKKADVPWEDLSQEYKDSNRKAADHIGVKMRSIGCELVNLDDPRPEAVFSEEEIEELAKLEHRRWIAERSLAGWTYHTTPNEQIRQTSYLTDWKHLAADIQDYDRGMVRQIPAILEKVGQKVVRK